MKHIFPLVVLLPLSFACGKREEPPPASPPTQQTTKQPVTEPAPGAAAPVGEKAKAQVDKYTVARGDTLSSIARKNGLDYRDLAKWNNIEDPDQIHVGQKLRLTAPGS